MTGVTYKAGEEDVSHVANSTGCHVVKFRSSKPPEGAKVRFFRKKEGLIVGLFAPSCAAGRGTLV